MESKIAKALKMKLNPVALIWTDEKPKQALEFKEGRWGCVMWLFTSAVKGHTAVFSRETYGCWGGGVALGFGNVYEKFPGGLDCFYYFLSTGNRNWEKGRIVAEQIKPFITKEFLEDFLMGERYMKSPEDVRSFVENLPILDIPAKYVILKPLNKIDLEREKPKVVIFPVTPNQLSALVILANYGKRTINNVIVPWAAGCQTMGIFAYREAESDSPRAIIGLIDISARNNVRKQLGDNIFTFIVPYKLFSEMEDNVSDSFLERPTWLSLIDEV